MSAKSLPPTRSFCPLWKRTQHNKFNFLKYNILRKWCTENRSDIKSDTQHTWVHCENVGIFTNGGHNKRTLSSIEYSHSSLHSQNFSIFSTWFSEFLEILDIVWNWKRHACTCLKTPLLDYNQFHCFNLLKSHLPILLYNLQMPKLVFNCS